MNVFNDAIDQRCELTPLHLPVRFKVIFRQDLVVLMTSAINGAKRALPQGIAEGIQLVDYMDG